MSRPRDGRQVQMPREQLLAPRQLLEAIGVELHDGNVVDLLEEKPAGSRAPASYT
jgi:hypothetical protein